MSDNVLKKEFREKDVQRIRNIYNKKANNSTTIGIGYEKKEEFHKEGDEWYEDGRLWVIKDGIKQNLTKLDKAKQSYLLPLFCPKCGKVMKNRNDSDFFKIHKMCFNCVIEMEHQLKKEGKWEEYENKIHNDEIDNQIREFKIWIKEKTQESNNSFFSEDGKLEKWSGELNLDKVDEYTESVINYLESLKK